MSESKFEPTPEAVEREAKRLANIMFVTRVWETLFELDKEWSRRAAAHVLRERHEREAPLVEALRDAGTRLQYLGDVVSAPRAWDALRAHAALDAPPKAEPTLAEAVEAMFASLPPIVYSDKPVTMHALDVDGTRLALVRPNALEAVRAALAREKERGK